MFCFCKGSSPSPSPLSSPRSPRTLPAVVLPRQPTPPELPPALPPAQIAVVLQAADAAASPQLPSPDVEFISSITSGQTQLCNDPLPESDLEFLKMVSTFGMNLEIVSDVEEITSSQNSEHMEQVSAAAAAETAAADFAEAEEANQVSAAAAAAAADKAAADLAEAEQAAWNLPSKVGALKKAIQSAAAAATASAELPSAPVFKKRRISKKSGSDATQMTPKKEKYKGA